MQSTQLQLTLPEVNQLLDALGEKSYKEVYQLIIKIQQQAESQLQTNDAYSNGHQPEHVSKSNEQ